jgi:hypothetical protein
VVNRETFIAGAFTLVCVMSSEPILRCFNLETRENQVMYLNNISTSDPGAKGAATLEVTALSYHSEDHILAVGLSDGHIRCFHHLQERRCDALRLSYGLHVPWRIACCPELTYCKEHFLILSFFRMLLVRGICNVNWRRKKKKKQVH